MINANELRIGNYFKTKSGAVRQVESIDDYGIDLYYDEVREAIGYDFKSHEIEPIPLTEQWLLDFGFEAHLSEQTRTRGKLITYTKHYGLSLLIRDGYFNAVVSGAIIKSVFTVHQLQNLYFALTGQELTLKQKK